MIFTVICILILWAVSTTYFRRYTWLITFVIIGGYVWLFRDLTPFDIGRITSNITSYFAPLTSLAAGLLVMMASKPRPEKDTTLAGDNGIIVILLYHVIFFFVAYPHTEATHLSWSYPTAMILFFFLMEKARRFIVNSWPEKTRGSVGRIIAATLSLFLPVLITLNQCLWILMYFYDVSPDLRHWSRREYVRLESERADIYEFVGSAYQITYIDRFIQSSTQKGEYIFEFPTTFFYFYSQSY